MTDSVAPFPLERDLLHSSVEVIPSAPLFAETIRRLADGGSISALLGDDE